MINTYNNPLQTGCGYYVNGVRNGGHMLIVHGVKTETSDSTSTNYVYVCDPATGSSSWSTFSNFCNGYGGRKYDQTVYTYFGSVD